MENGEIGWDSTGWNGNWVQHSQVRYILRAFGSRLVETEPPFWAGRGDCRPVRFLYRKDHLLIGTEDLPRLRDLPDGPGKEVVDYPVPGLALVQVRVAEDETLLDVLARLETRLGPDVVAPDTVMSISPPSQPGTLCPATEPDPVPGGACPRPAVACGPCDGHGTLVAVVDTGLLKAAPRQHEWLRGVTGVYEPETVPGRGKMRKRHIGRYTGHGTFAASIVRAMAPQAEVRVERIFRKAGACFESEVVKALYGVMARPRPPDVISLSAGTHTWRDRGLLSFRVFINGPLRNAQGTVLVAAAGNDGMDWKFAPAEMASDNVVSVGALAVNEETRAWFSNYGDWVKVYAPGEDLVHAYANGLYYYFETRERPPERFHGMASWSGTSFSTPVVSGLIAARMSATPGKSAQVAAQELLMLAGAQKLPGVGPVLRPGQACLVCEGAQPDGAAGQPVGAEG
jgi:hypothetical protein